MVRRLAPIAEQLMLSALSLFINIVLIATTTKEHYGVFSVLNSYLILATSIQTAIFSVPMMVELSREDGKARDHSIVVTSWALLPVSAAFALLSAICVVAFSTSENGLTPVLLGSAFALAMAGAWSREFVRTIYVLQDRLQRSFLVSLSYAVAVVGGISFFYLRKGEITTTEIFVCLGLASFIASFDVLPAFRQRIQFKDLIQLFGRLGQHSKWALPGVMTSWIQNNAYLSIVTSQGGASVAADLSASRLFVMPYMTAFAGHSRVVVRRLSATLDTHPDETKNAAIRLAFIQLSIGAALAAVFVVAEKLNIGQYLRSYSGALPLAAMWAIFAGIGCAKAALNLLAQAGRAFRTLFLMNVISALVVLGALFLPHAAGLAYIAICALILGETVSLVFLWWKYKLQLRRPHGR